MTITHSPFETDTDLPFVALCGNRAGYIQLATCKNIEHFQHLPADLLTTAQDWAKQLEKLGTKRVYWFILSEQIRHLHIHLYPRWSDEETLRGTALFEARDSLSQPKWTAQQWQALKDWAETHQVYLFEKQAE